MAASASRIGNPILIHIFCRILCWSRSNDLDLGMVLHRPRSTRSFGCICVERAHSTDAASMIQVEADHGSITHCCERMFSPLKSASAGGRALVLTRVDSRAATSTTMSVYLQKHLTSFTTMQSHLKCGEQMNPVDCQTIDSSQSILSHRAKHP